VLPQQLQFSSIDHVSRSALVSLINIEHVQDVKLVIDANKELVDLRAKNSWTMELDQVGLSEFMEVYFINAAAPFMLCSLLKPMMSNPSFIVNVSAVEGQFYRSFKNSTHPHTNMAKAALNMMTRTCGSYYSNSGIYMNAADTGWVTDENPLSFTRGITVPLDEVDGAMRVLDCVFEGYNN
jgi:NAD(P)-dependent dehydrogenase (short-subunit alcohol dehydrogenase family)